MRSPPGAGRWMPSMSRIFTEEESMSPAGRWNADFLQQWLSIPWESPGATERTFYPDLISFMSDLLGFPRDRIRQEMKAGEGYPDLVLWDPDGDPWLLVDLKLDDAYLTDPGRRRRLWEEKRKYLSSMARGMIFLTPRWLWARDPMGEAPAPGLEEPLDLVRQTPEGLRERLAFWGWEEADHERRWQAYRSGRLPFGYIPVSDPDGVARLREDLRRSFEELLEAARRALDRMRARWEEVDRFVEEVGRHLMALPAGEVEKRREEVRRRLMSADPHAFRVREAFQAFREAYQESSGVEREDLVREAFCSNGVALLLAQALFLRLLEDRGLLSRRRLTDGGPQVWSELMEFLHGNVRVMLRMIAMDVAVLFPEPFRSGALDWLYEANAGTDRALQRLLLRLNAYDLSELSEEILGDIYQGFLPERQRRRVGEFYTPPVLVDWILDRTGAGRGEGEVLDPACGSGSFLVRLAHRWQEEIRTRGVPPEEVARWISERLWGFDLNPFAAYMTSFQLLWALLRTGVSPQRALRLRVFELDSLDSLPRRLGVRLGVSGAQGLLNEEKLWRHEGERARDRRRWRWVVGNPPYVRAERAKSDHLGRLWPEIWGQNADVGLVFLYRALTEWLDEGGCLGMVVSGGYAGSDAAAPLWKRLAEGRDGLALREIAWLEFAGPIWDVARVPMVIVVERRPANARPPETIRLWVPSRFPPGEEEAVEVPATAFWEIGEGERLPVLLQPEDIPLLRRLKPGQGGIAFLRDAVQGRRDRRGRLSWWTYGIQRGGAPAIPLEEARRREGLWLPVLSGKDLAVAYHADPQEAIFLEEVARRAYGKLSLWGPEPEGWPREILACGEIVRAPFAVLVRSEPDRPVGMLNTVLVALPRPEGPDPRAVAAYLNSAVVRWWWALRRRSGVVQGFYANCYPRDLDELPWPANASRTDLARLADLYDHLADTARQLVLSPDRILEEALEEARDWLLLGSAELGLDFRAWHDEAAPSSEDLRVEGSVLRGGLLAGLDLRDPDLAEMVLFLLRRKSRERPERIRREDLFRLRVPANYRELIAWRRRLEAELEPRKRSFEDALREIDEISARMLGLSEKEAAWIRGRLERFPLQHLQPRYPWELPARRRPPTRHYEEDRFR